MSVRSWGDEPAVGSGCGSIERVYDMLGRTTRYKDATGAWTSSEYDRYGRPAIYREYLNGYGPLVGLTTVPVLTTRTFTYDKATEPRGYLTKVALRNSLRLPLGLFWSGPAGQSAARNWKSINPAKGAMLEDMWYGKAAGKIQSVYKRQNALTGMMWDAASRAFARGASKKAGAIHFSFGKLSPRSTWSRVERPTLVKNGIPIQTMGY